MLWSSPNARNLLHVWSLPGLDVTDLVNCVDISLMRETPEHLNSMPGGIRSGLSVVCSCPLQWYTFIVTGSGFRFVKWLVLVQTIKLEGLKVTCSPSSFIICTRSHFTNLKSHFTNLKLDALTIKMFLDESTAPKPRSELHRIS